jgi:hypothetical protein
MVEVEEVILMVEVLMVPMALLEHLVVVLVEVMHIKQLVELEIVQQEHQLQFHSKDTQGHKDMHHSFMLLGDREAVLAQQRHLLFQDQVLDMMHLLEVLDYKLHQHLEIQYQ